MSAFDAVARYYALLSDTPSRRERELPFLAHCLEQAPGPRVLDMACGTGFHAEILAGMGAEVTARDLSPHMVAHAAANHADRHIDYGTADMRQPSGGPYDAAFCLGNSLSLLPSREDVARTLDAVAGVTIPGGLLALQVLNYAAPAAQQPRHRVERRSLHDGELVAVKSLVPHGGRTLLSLVFHRLHDGNHQAVTDTGVLLELSREELETALGEAHWNVTGVFGGFDRAPYVPENSADILLVARRI